MAGLAARGGIAAWMQAIVNGHPFYAVRKIFETSSAIGLHICTHLPGHGHVGEMLQATVPRAARAGSARVGMESLCHCYTVEIITPDYDADSLQRHLRMCR
eukprot:545767-Amphidinium_carterae.1